MELVGLNNITPGTVINFGSWIQYDNTSAMTPIEWIVLDTDGHTAMLISRYGLEVMAYHDEQREVTRETCTLRKWLNNTFLNEAFTAEEQSQLQEVTIKNPIYPESEGVYGSDTQERVYRTRSSRSGSPSAELSCGRGGPHCMTMALIRGEE